MTFTKQQTIILFCLASVVGVLIYIVGTQLIGSENQNTTIKESDNSILNEVRRGFQETVESTESEEELAKIGELNKLQKAEKFPSVNAPEIREPEEFIDIDPLQNYRYLEGELYIYNEKISKLGVFSDNTSSLITDNQVNEWADGTTIIKLVDSAEPFLDKPPILRSSNQTEFNNSVYLAKSNVYFYLGDNITNIYQFEINGNKFWVSVLENNTGSNQFYFSGEFFKGIQKLKGVTYQDGKVYQNGNFLYIDKLVSGTEGIGTQKLRVDIKGIAESKVLGDYSKFVSVEK